MVNDGASALMRGFDLLLGGPARENRRRRRGARRSVDRRAHPKAPVEADREAMNTDLQEIQGDLQRAFQTVMSSRSQT